MIGATAKAEQFQSRSGSDATKGSRKGFGLLGGGECVIANLSQKEKRDSLIARLKYLMALRAVGAMTRSEKQDLHNIQVELKETRGEAKKRRLTNLPECFIDICRERMPLLEFDRLMTEAAKRAKDANEKAMQVRAEQDRA